MNTETREVRMFYECKNSINNLPNCIKQFDSQSREWNSYEHCSPND